MTNECSLYLISLQCPVFDLVRNVEFSGEYQTVTKKGAITVTVSVFQFCVKAGVAPENVKLNMSMVIIIRVLQ